MSTDNAERLDEEREEQKVLEEQFERIKREYEQWREKKREGN